MKEYRGMLIGAAFLVVIAIVTAMLLPDTGGTKNSNGTSGSDNMSMDHQAESSKSESSESTDAKNAVETNAVTIQNYAFEAPVIKVKVGTTVTWTNKDGVRHDVAPDSPSADFTEGKLIAKDETYSYTFKKAGTYNYHCTPHPYMKGTVIVTQ